MNPCEFLTKQEELNHWLTHEICEELEEQFQEKSISFVSIDDYGSHITITLDSLHYLDLQEEWYAKFSLCAFNEVRINFYKDERQKRVWSKIENWRSNMRKLQE